jgi:hypothetical protein
MNQISTLRKVTIYIYYCVHLTHVIFIARKAGDRMFLVIVCTPLIRISHEHCVDFQNISLFQ